MDYDNEPVGWDSRHPDGRLPTDRVYRDPQYESERDEGSASPHWILQLLAFVVVAMVWAAGCTAKFAWWLLTQIVGAFRNRRR